MAPPITTEQKTRIVEWFLQTNSIVTVQRRFKNQYKWKEAPAKEYGEDVGGAVSRNWECDAQEKRREQASHVLARPTLLGPFVWVWPDLQHESLCDS